MSAFLALAEDTDVARNLDVDGLRKELSAQVQLESSLAEEYGKQVDLARRLVRKLEVDKQAVYDDGSSLWTAVQAAFSTETSQIFSPPDGWSSHLSPHGYVDVMYAAVNSLRTSLAGTLETFEALVEVGRNQEEGAKRGVRGSIGLRDGQSLVIQQQNHRLLNHIGEEETQTTTLPRLNAHMLSSYELESQMASLDLSMMSDSDGEADGEDGGDGEDEMVDVGFALGTTKKSKRLLQHQASPPQVQPSSRMGDANARFISHHRLLSVAASSTEVGDDGTMSIADSKTSTIRPESSVDMRKEYVVDEEEEDDDDDDFRRKLHLISGLDGVLMPDY